MAMEPRVFDACVELRPSNLPSGDASPAGDSFPSGDAAPDRREGDQNGDVGSTDVVLRPWNLNQPPIEEDSLNPRECAFSDGLNPLFSSESDNHTTKSNNPNSVTQESNSSGWKRRSIGLSGPDARIIPSKRSAVEERILQNKHQTGSEIFEPTEGLTFDSCQEAYDFYNLYSWEHGFGIRHGKGRTNTKGYRTMHEFVCQCEGNIRKENASSCRTGCKAMVRLLRTEDHGWYVAAFVRTHNHRLSVGCDEKRQWNSHNEIDPLSRDLIKNLRANNVSVSKVYNILAGSGDTTQVLPYRKQALRSLCAKLAQDSIVDDIGKTRKLLNEMKAHDPNFRVEIDADIDGRVRSMIWCTGKNRADYAVFGDVVTFDTTYKTNLYNMPFGLFVGVNNHYQSVIYGGALMRQETTEAFEWVFSTFVDIMNNKHPKTILTDQAQAMKNAIETPRNPTKKILNRDASAYQHLDELIPRPILS